MFGVFLFRDVCGSLFPTESRNQMPILVGYSIGVEAERDKNCSSAVGGVLFLDHGLSTNSPLSNHGALCGAAEYVSFRLRGASRPRSGRNHVPVASTRPVATTCCFPAAVGVDNLSLKLARGAVSSGASEGTETSKEATTPQPATVPAPPKGLGDSMSPWTPAAGRRISCERDRDVSRSWGSV
jgi:hypothetical protein